MRVSSIAAAGLLSLTAGCTVPRPAPAPGAPACALPGVPLRIDLGTGSRLGAQAEAPEDPMVSILRNAAAARSAGIEALGPPQPRASHLVLSGGGQDGAFGSGFLAGLAPLPDYDVVTGVSTGALQAPLALLGNEAPPDDRRLDAADDFPADANRPGRRNIDDLVSGYSISREGSLYRSRGVAGILRKAASGDLAPLRRRIGLLITDQTLRRLAMLDPRRRGLFTLLLNWDTGDAERIDMLELARRYAGGDRHARDCFIDVMIAASSEPLGTPPVPIDDHLYVDAGLRFGVFAVNAIEAGAEAARTFRSPRAAGTASSAPVIRTDMIRNGDLTVPYSAPPRYSALDIVGRARKILVNQVYAFSMRDVLARAGDGQQVRFAFITKDEIAAGPPAKGVEFDPAYMARMLLIGRDRRGAWNEVRPS
ncbi:patatin-like phospholipase family protein [Sphingomonas sp.]|uniref:patatin-like phospholipase family protein n=1 Tax=Sphingomonas sp. TaxID=28214 RepID=UPI001B084FA8|nr:patatin-like phospholipase family protein [Sphingomonas sp.]MBO9712735.1 patatin-like phospholipase family protein [Sphingomonas sp.]